MTTPALLLDGPASAPLTLVLAHGAGAPMDSEFMQWFAGRLAGDRLRVARFEFPYMQARRETGSKKPPNPARILLQSWREVIDALAPARLVIGGKSMGGRMASMVADETGVAGLICLGYPFHPPGKPERTRIEHLAALRTPALFCQGERDPFGRREEVERYRLSDAIGVHWLTDGDHGFKPRKSSGHDEAGNRESAAAAIEGFLDRL